MLASKLPTFFKRAPFLNIVQHLETSQAMFSSLLCEHHGNFHLFQKDNESHIPLDWQLYTLLRASARLKLTTGGNIRAEPDMYRELRSYGDPKTEELYRALAPQDRQKIMVFSKQLNKQQLDDSVNSQHYERLEMPKFDRLADCVDELKQQNQPVLVEFGLILLNRMIAEMKKGSPNPIDTMLLTVYHGDFPQKYLGDNFVFPVNDYYDLKWQSEGYPCNLHTGQEGKLAIYLYKKKGMM